MPRPSPFCINTLWTRETLIQWSTMYDNCVEKLPSNLSFNATVGQHKLTPPPTLDTQALLLPNADYLPIVGDWNGEGRDVSTRWWVLHTTSLGLQSAPRSLARAWCRKGPSIRNVLHGSCARVLSMERLCTSRGDLRTRLHFRSKELSGVCS